MANFRQFPSCYLISGLGQVTKLHSDQARTTYEASSQWPLVWVSVLCTQDVWPHPEGVLTEIDHRLPLNCETLRSSFSLGRRLGLALCFDHRRDPETGGQPVARTWKLQCVENPQCFFFYFATSSFSFVVIRISLGLRTVLSCLCMQLVVYNKVDQRNLLWFAKLGDWFPTWINQALRSDNPSGMAMMVRYQIILDWQISTGSGECPVGLDPD